MTAIPKSDFQGEDPIMILVEQLRQSARISTAPEMNPQGFPIEKNLYWRAAEALLALSQERDRLREALGPFAAIPPVTVSEIDQRPLWAAHYWCVVGHPDKSHFTREDLARARAALHKDQAS
jgi:hypothetical protein